MGAHPQSLDTSVDAERRQLAIWREMSVADKLRLMGELCDSVQYLAEIGLRERHPDASDEEIRMRRFSTWLDRDTMIRCYGWDPLEPPGSSIPSACEEMPEAARRQRDTPQPGVPRGGVAAGGSAGFGRGAKGCDEH